MPGGEGQWWLHDCSSCSWARDIGPSSEGDRWRQLFLEGPRLPWSGRPVRGPCRTGTPGRSWGRPPGGGAELLAAVPGGTEEGGLAGLGLGAAVCPESGSRGPCGEPGQVCAFPFGPASGLGPCGSLLQCFIHRATALPSRRTFVGLSPSGSGSGDAPTSGQKDLLACLSEAWRFHITGTWPCVSLPLTWSLDKRLRACCVSASC